MATRIDPGRAMDKFLSKLRCRKLTAEQRRRRSGQALLESFGIIVLLCLLLFGVVQYTLMLTAKEVVQYGADAGVRARAVGFNNFMVYKVVRVATIPNAGTMLHPNPIPYGDANTWYGYSAGQSFNEAVRVSPRSDQYWNVEQYNIPLYLGSMDWQDLPGYLDYDDWDTVNGPGYFGIPGQTIGVSVSQDYPLRMPFVRNVWSDDDEIRLTASASLADHSALYLE